MNEGDSEKRILYSTISLLSMIHSLTLASCTPITHYWRSLVSWDMGEGEGRRNEK